MELEYTFWGRIFCKWLGWHSMDMKTAWLFNNQMHAHCRFCGVVLSRPAKPKEYRAKYCHDWRSKSEGVLICSICGKIYDESTWQT